MLWSDGLSFYPFQFEAPIVYQTVGSDTYAYTVVFLPGDLQARLPLGKHPRLRVCGEIGEQPFEGALTPVRGRWYLLLSKKMLKAMGAAVGDTVEVRLAIADQDAVDLPQALAAALGRDAAMRNLWDAQTPGKRRGLAHRVASAKSDITRAKRIAEVFGILRGDLDMRGKPKT